MPGMVRSRRSASPWVLASSRSRLSATVHALMIVWARTPSTPARCQSQDGMRRHVFGSGKTRMPLGAGPGGWPPNLASRIRHARCASMDEDLLLEHRRDERLHQAADCGRDGDRGACGRPGAGRDGRRGRSRKCRRAGRGRRGGRRAASPLPDPRPAPGPGGPAVPHEVAPGRGPMTRIVAGPSGVSEVRHTAPASSTAEGRVAPAPALHGQRDPNVDEEGRPPFADAGGLGLSGGSGPRRGRCRSC